MFESMMHGTMDMCIVDPTVGNTYAKELELFSPAVPFPQLRALGSGSGWRNRARISPT